MLAEKRYIWHPMLKEKAVEDRLYQNRILERARQCNTLVVLPTALGKTVIALLLALEKAGEGKIFFLAPTRPLVQQHHQTFLDKTWFDEGELALVTGRYPPNQRYNAMCFLPKASNRPAAAHHLPPLKRV